MCMFVFVNVCVCCVCVCECAGWVAFGPRSNAVICDGVQKEQRDRWTDIK